jgi:hypothetical protein
MIRMIKSTRVRWAGHEEKRNACRISMGRPEGKRLLGRPNHRWEDNVQMDLREREWGGMGQIDLA